MTVEPAVASNVTSPALVVTLMGVMSFKLVPTSIYNLLFVPIAKKLSLKDVTQLNNPLHVPDKEVTECFCHPFNFSG